MKEHKGKSGIYKITNKVNGKVYIGKTIDFYKRYFGYVSDFRSNSNRVNRYLLASVLKYGFDNFEFSVVEFCEVNDLAERELFWMLHYDSINRNKGYNLRLDSSTGMVTHQATRDLISERLKKEWSEGVRSGHSDKLKESWLSRDKGAQGRLFSKILTKYYYIIRKDDKIITMVDYKGLCSLGLKNVMVSFSKKKINRVRFKDYDIERIDLYES